MSELTLRPMIEDDLAAVTDLETKAYSQPWSSRVFTDELEQAGRTYLVIEDELEVLGYAGLMVVGDEAHVTTVVVHPERREDKLGTRLMLALVEAARQADARSLTLEVRASNIAAQRLYQRFGMAPVGVRKKYYKDEDAMIMWVHDIDGEDFAQRVSALEESLR